VEYGLEVIKSGTLVEERSITDKPFITFGRSPTADVLLEHPSASRLHAVLQFRGEDGKAFLYDCGSTHGTFINKQRLKPQAMAPLRCVWVLCTMMQLYNTNTRSHQGYGQILIVACCLPNPRLVTCRCCRYCCVCPEQLLVLKAVSAHDLPLAALPTSLPCRPSGLVTRLCLAAAAACLC
jgi:hypothetical protein